MARLPKPDAEFGDIRSRATNIGQFETRGRKTGSAAVAELQARSLEYFAQGMNVPQVMAKLDRSTATYQSWRGRTPGYAEKVDHIKAKVADDFEPKEVGDFGEWRSKYMKMETFWHQWQWVDLMHGKDPRGLHPSQQYRPGVGKENILLNTPPNHAKSTVITEDYVTYRICEDPYVRVLIVSETGDTAKRFAQHIKRRLSHPEYAELIQDFGPGPNGFRDPDQPWTNNEFYVYGNNPAERDPTVRSVGLNGQIYGSRADLIILDDCVTLKSSRSKGQRDKTLDWIRQEVMSRLEPVTGRLIIVGTRVSADDLYGEILRQDEANYWTYLTQPAILEYGETPEENKTLWPHRFPASELIKIMARYGTDMARFRLVYQQEAAPEDAVFPEDAVEMCRTTGGAGFIPENVRPGGLNGLYVVAGLDPAASGFTAIVVLGIDKRTKVRYVIDCMNQRAIKPHQLREKMVEYTTRYKINEWRIEKNGLQTLLSQDRDMRMQMLALNARVYEHHTVEYGSSGKWDPDYGVASMAPLFLGAYETPKANLIAIPYNGTHRATRELTDQLISWEPGTVGKTDLVMALWFAELGCRKQLIQGQTTHVTNRWASRGRVDSRKVVNIQDYMGASA